LGNIERSGPLDATPRGRLAGSIEPGYRHEIRSGLAREVHMFEPKVVLAPTDFSDSARDALETAAGVASRYGATLVLVHVVPALPRLPAAVSIFKEGDYEQSQRDEASKRLAELSAKYAKSGVSVKSEVGLANDVANEILLIAGRHKADLLVIATHGMTGWKELVYGSVAEKVVRMARGAVLVLKDPPRQKA
jgi:nucleotide-binding universal stress UspA family protein